MDYYQPPPQKPDLEPKPAGSFLWWLIVIFGGLLLLAAIAFLATPVLWVAFTIALIIGLQYLLWGCWFERIYRSNPSDTVATRGDNQDFPVKPFDSMKS